MKMRIGYYVCSIVAGLLAVTVLDNTVEAQTTENTRPAHDQHQEADQNDLQMQIHGMQQKIAMLESALKQNHSETAGESQEMTDMSGMPMGDKGMGMKGGGKTGKGSDMDAISGMQMGSGGNEQGMGMMSGMSGMQMGGGGMSGMQKGGGGMGMGMGMMGKGMSMMGKTKGMDGMNMASSLPGFPGASHIYHVGADGFFLDHAQHIELTANQQTRLNQLKEDQILKQADFDRKIESAEQQLWVLTSSDTPEANEIEDKIAEISKLQGEQRFAYIRAVGEAAETLTDEQRKTLTGMLEQTDATDHGDY